MRKKTFFDGLCVAMLSFCLVTLLLPLSSVHASNYQDKDYYVRYNGDGGDVYTTWEEKQDSTSVYIKHAGNVGVYASIRVAGYSGNFTWSGNYVSVPTGTGYYITNRVRETFNKDVMIRLGLSPATHTSTTIHGVWSPDSI